MQNNETDMPPFKNEGASAEQAQGSREGWDIQTLGDEASQKDVNEIQREILRGDETKGDADERDIVGSVDSSETWHGREEVKTQTKAKADIDR